MPAHYIIDGYNVMHYVLNEARDAIRLVPHDLEANRQALIEYFGAYCSTTPITMALVFDGQGKKAESSFPFGDRIPLEVIYAPAAHSADVIIQRAVYHSATPGQIVVVSDDRGIRDLVGSKGAMVMRPRNFLATLREMTQANAPLRGTGSPDTMAEVGSRLDDHSLGRLEQLRKQLEAKANQTKKGL